LRRLLAWLVHVYTALGAAVAVFTLAMAAEGRYREALALMGLALLLDATDGTLARAAKVKEIVPGVDGARLDDIVDYLNYVLVPCFLLLWAGLLPAGHGWWIVCLPLLASAYGFSQTDAKTPDHYFLGFPSYWNVVAFYCFVLEWSPWFNGLLVIALSVMVFVPIRYLYPSRNTLLQGLTLTLGGIWGVLCMVVVYYLPEPPYGLAAASLFFPAYYLVLSLWSHLRHGPSTSPAPGSGRTENTELDRQG